MTTIILTVVATLVAILLVVIVGVVAVLALREYKRDQRNKRLQAVAQGAALATYLGVLASIVFANGSFSVSESIVTSVTPTSETEIKS